MPSSEAENIIKWFNEFDSLKFNFIDEIDDLKQAESNVWIAEPGWKKLADAFDMDVKIIVDKYNEDVDCWKAKAEAEMTDGRIMHGVGMSPVQEKAKTRAKNRAISDMIAAGRVSYEEIVDE